METILLLRNYFSITVDNLQILQIQRNRDMGSGKRLASAERIKLLCGHSDPDSVSTLCGFSRQEVEE